MNRGGDILGADCCQAQETEKGVKGAWEGNDFGRTEGTTNTSCAVLHNGQEGGANARKREPRHYAQLEVRRPKIKN